MSVLSERHGWFVRNLTCAKDWRCVVGKCYTSKHPRVVFDGTTRFGHNPYFTSIYLAFFSQAEYSRFSKFS